MSFDQEKLFYCMIRDFLFSLKILFLHLYTNQFLFGCHSNFRGTWNSSREIIVEWLISIYNFGKVWWILSRLTSFFNLNIQKSFEGFVILKYVPRFKCESVFLFHFFHFLLFSDKQFLHGGYCWFLIFCWSQKEIFSWSICFKI